MNKIIWISAAVLSVAACAKNEVIPVNSGENQEITFNVAPKTKANPEPQPGVFSTDNVFASWAYYLPNTEGTSWDKNRTGAKIYIGKEGDEGVTISHDKVKNVWKNVYVSYYWPKDGKLTFFAYSLNRGSLSDKSASGMHFYCQNHEKVYGICGTLELGQHPNTDFLVADMSSEKSVNESLNNINGVPTLFKHRLSMVKFAVKKNAAYANATIKVNSIVFKNICTGMTYSQFYQKPDETFSEYILPGTVMNQNCTKENTSFTVTSTDFTPIPNEDIYIYIPQTFDLGSKANKNAYIEVKYSITTSKTITDSNGQAVDQEIFTEDVTKQIFLNPADGQGTKMFDSWEKGKKYTINLTFTLDEILWAPAVEDWADGTTAADQIVA